MLIHSQMIIADIFGDWPETIPVFMEYRMSCVGCAMSSFDTLSDAIRVYNIHESRFLTDLNAAAASDETVPDQ